MFVDLGSIPTVAQDGKRYQGETSALFVSVFSFRSIQKVMFPKFQQVSTQLKQQL